MITTAEFKKQIAKPFGNEMRKLGFKGTGLNYFQETDDFIFAVYIGSGRWGGSCHTGLVIHPKQVYKNSVGLLNLKKLQLHQYEFRMNLSEIPCGESWEYADDPETNLNTLNEIIGIIKSRAIPIIDSFKSGTGVLETFTVADLKEFHENYTKKTGSTIATSEFRFAWAMTLIFEHKNPSKARQFAKWALSHLREDDDWFGTVDFKRVAASGHQ